MTLTSSFKIPSGAQTIYEPVLTHLDQVVDSIRGIVVPDTEWLAETIMASLQSRGKMLRPLIALLASGATTVTPGQLEKKHVEMAAVAELIHVATLLHDDVLDKSDLRRGRPTIRAQWGNKVSILSGDYLLAQASLKLSQLDNCRLVGIFSNVLAKLCEGEVEQIRTTFSTEVNWPSYFNKSICKTASLFAACGESAGVINQLPEPQIQSLAQFATDFGIAFQIIDDLLDYTADEATLGKPVMDDLKNGILTAPILLALEAAETSESPLQRKRILQCLEGIFDTTADEATKKTLSAQLKNHMEALNAFENTKALALKYAQQAREALAFVTESPYKAALLGLVDLTTVRSL